MDILKQHMEHYIDADKLLAKIEQKISICEKQRSDAIEVECFNLADDASARMGELHVIQETIASLQQEQPDCIWIHKKYNREYKIISDKARLKDSDGKWIDCVIYAPLYENEFEMFAREKDSFYKEFEKK